MVINMIKLTKVAKKESKEFYLNCDLIETIEEPPDTTIKLLNGRILIVGESPSEIIEKVIAYKRKIFGKFN